jgi:hypothetical protein
VGVEGAIGVVFVGVLVLSRCVLCDERAMEMDWLHFSGSEDLLPPQRNQY